MEPLLPKPDKDGTNSINGVDNNRSDSDSFDNYDTVDDLQVSTMIN